ncbi:type III-A CRISPR-associated RAMP protein Csm3 [Flammeovirga sp. SJP92]|uniref:type III-A CRISPR-associated RAMP protein Csm3 n=1 Tax=Flammeovirga sp. SJP92 TaxID=1775430 RepID=UPI0007C8257C|nr:type III-A CRISPR-associated RAMP protein Csm3 [Flammeovirga sp. SJP92]
MAKKLVKKIIIKGNIEAKTGLHIGGSNLNLQIGGVDSAIVKNPLTDKPYIPGSSLKGKIRSLLEQTNGLIGGAQGKQIQHGPSKKGKVAEVFGRTDNEGNSGNIPSRVIFRDCELIDEEEVLKNNKNTDLPYTEVKTEIVMDRITAAATPRQLERVPAGTTFDLELVINIYEGHEVYSERSEEETVQLIFGGLQLLQDDYIGGSGSRGSGQIKFNIEQVLERDIETYYGKADASDVDYTTVALPDSLKA